MEKANKILKSTTPKLHKFLKINFLSFKKSLYSLIGFILLVFYKVIMNKLNLIRNSNKKSRKLEIGPGKNRINGFETLNAVWSRNTDYIYNASKKLPFKDNTFNLIYASHILEHIPWYKSEKTIQEWARILKPGGTIEIWVPDALKIAKAFIKAEESDSVEFKLDGWFKFNPEKNSAIWFNGRIFSYGDGKGNKRSFNWHMSAYSTGLLSKLLNDSGFNQIEIMDINQVRGYNHGWINLGIKGVKNEL